MLSSDETIAAVASAAGGAARGIVRVSGPDVRGCLERSFVPDDPAAWNAVRHSTAFPGSITLAPSGARLPCRVYLWPGKRSYTRQPLAEIHTLGSPPLVEAVMTTLAAAGARPARPGEFTLRAFLAGRLDLTQAEAVLGVIDAADARQLATALEQLAGGLAGPLHQLRGELLDLLAHLEAGLDFADEAIEFITAQELSAQLAHAAEQVRGIQQRMTGRAHVSHAVRVVLIGAPNVGKSTLFNALAGRDAALVSPQAGTTRDYLVALLEIAGMRLELIDTAGHDRQQLDAISTAAAAAARGQAEQADIQLFCLDSTREPLDWERQQLSSIESSSSGAAAGLSSSAVPPGPLRLAVWTKSDAANCQRDDDRLCVSALSGAGLDALRDRLQALVAEIQSPDCRVVAGTAVRSRASLESAAEALAIAQQLTAQQLTAQRLAVTSSGEELVASELRIALDALGEVVGAVYTDDILDRIFSRFCIGK